MRSLTWMISALCLTFTLDQKHRAPAQTETYTVTFQVDVSALAPPLENVGVRGSLAPLSWDSTHPLTDPDGDGIYSGTVVLAHPERQVLEYKYVHGETTWELDLAPNRRLALVAPELVQTEIWDQDDPFPPAELHTRRLPAADLLADFQLMKWAYTTLHPGLTRYQTPEALLRRFDALETYLSQDRTVAEAFLAYAKFLAQIKCGHTYLNTYNQPDFIKRGLFFNADKLPFTFQWIDRRMIATQALDADDRIRPGTEVLRLNGVPVQSVLDSLLTIVHADGSNDGKRLRDLDVHAGDEYPAFDIYYPLFFPIDGRTLPLEAQNPAGQPFTVEVALGTPQQRKDAWMKRNGPLPEKYDDLWAFEWLDDHTAYLKLGSFVTWRMERDWKAFLDTAFAEAKAKPAHNLIIDIRGNGGGATDVARVLVGHLLSRQAVVPAYRQVVAYETVPADLRPFVRTWDAGALDFSGEVERLADGRYTFINQSVAEQILPPNPDAYTGTVYMLVDATNSSATHGLAQMVQVNGLATLVGRETGGNLKGLNGGQMFFLDLPHTHLEMDIPIYASYSRTEQPDRGVIPDVVVHYTIEDLTNGTDADLEAVRRLIKAK